MRNFTRLKPGKVCVLLLACCLSDGAFASPSARSSLTTANFTSAKLYLSKPVNWPITGKVSSAKGEPLPGVTVLLKGTTIGATTGLDGTYAISVPEQGGTLVFSFIGFTTTEKTFSGPGAVNITMSEDAKALQEVVVVGYGTQKKSQVTGAISSVSSKEISELPVTNAQQALQGRAAGVEVLSQGNSPGGGVNVRIRGRRSFNAGNDPLFVVDGIPLSGDISDINPQDIESMEVLKDASSTAIYGSRGANGVVIITTKRGTPGKVSVTYDGYYGVNKIINQYDVMNGPEFAEYKRESRRAIGKYNDADPVAADKAIFDAVELEGIASGRSTNYQDYITRTGSQQSHQLGISGGGEKTRYSVSFNHFYEKGVTIGQDFTRDNIRISLDQQITDRLKFGVTMLGSLGKLNIGPNPYGVTLRENPLGSPYDKDGKLLFRNTTDGAQTNPLLEVVPNAVVNENRRARIFTSLFAEYQIAQGLTYRLNFGPDYSARRSGQFQASLTNARSGGTPFARNDNNYLFSYTVENILNYSKTFKEMHDINITGLFSIQKEQREFYSIRASGLTSERQLFYKLSHAPNIEGIDSDLNESGLLSYMGRINYGFKDKYLLTLTTRIDGSSKFAGETGLFGDTKKYGFFPSAAIGWRLSEESFIKDIAFIDNLKLRASYGLTGNQGINAYATQGSLNRTTYAFGNSGAFGYSPNTLVNPNLRWETTATTNVGLDYGFLDNRISGSLEVYQQDTYDLLMPRNLPFTSGYGSVLQNVGKSKNTGVEFAISTVNVDMGGDGFKWTTDLNFNSNKEQIVEIYNGKNNDVGSLYFIGQPLTVYYDYDKLGIWQTSEADEAKKYKQNPGEIKVKDQNNDGAINALDRVILGSDIPDWSGGITNRFSYKGIDFSFFIFTRQGSLIQSDLYNNLNFLAGRYNNMDVDYWTPNNPTNAFPRPNQNQERPLYNTTMSYFDGSFTKVRNISLGYNIPAAISSKVKMSSLRVYASAQNPFIFSNYGKNLDPEQARGRNNDREQSNLISIGTPSARLIMFGINAKF
ncbi:SusC/RagA family TonB-linked outer membrane protein [Adhaeribacter aerolatus]|uniref:SusC/RagA family TonB-linked outer membrane protein n=1 Tax=Adhaeribacter aerolatus TaxID=670289 RepID=A0A512AZL0_9BACT|nr:TonB-dependent receptor [Adhaeribacter aerolatus]GEO05136.1 SusC/RagA family TonB-linked outer membrane protein [Adhaeribacter aerolatus]